MATLKQKQFTWLSLVLLLVTYTWFGWYLCSLKAPAWVYPVCHRLLDSPIPTQAQNFELSPDSTSESAESSPQPDNLRGAICKAMMEYNLTAGVLAIGWIVVSSLAFISPLTSFSAFISRWFKSDTVAFATLFLVAAGAAVILYWLHIFLQILTILAVDILARIDIQHAGLTGVQAFWILTILSLTGLVLGWLAKAMI